MTLLSRWMLRIAYFGFGLIILCLLLDM